MAATTSQAGVCEGLLDPSIEVASTTNDPEAESTANEERLVTGELERQALLAMKKLKLTDTQARDAVRKWFDEIHSHQAGGRKLTLIEHVTLQTILRTKFLEEDPDPTIIADVQNAYLQSWKDWTGVNYTLDQVLNRRLPKECLRDQEAKQIQFYDLALKVDPETKIVKAYHPVFQWMLDYAPLFVLAYGLGYGTAIPDSNPVAHALAAAAMAYSVATLAEYPAHRWVMHAPPHRMRMFEEKKSDPYLGWLYKKAARLARSHYVHHYLQSKEHYTDVPTYGQGDEPATEWERRLWKAQEKIKMDGLEEEYRYLLHIGYTSEQANQKIADLQAERERTGKQRKDIFWDNEVRGFKKTKDGVLLETVSFISTTLLLVGIGFGVEMGLRGDWHYLPISLLAGVLGPHVDFMHDLMHHKRSEPNSSMGKWLGGFKEWFQNTRYFRYIDRIHFAHHDPSPAGIMDFGILALNWDGVFGTRSELDLDRLVLMFTQDIYF
jgi:hypothetical protein